MSKIALHLENLSVPDKINLARTTRGAMKGHPDYAKPDVPYAELDGAADALEKSHQKMDDTHKAFLAASGQQTADERKLDELLRGQAHFVERASKGDEAKIKASGFPLAAPHVHSQGTLAAPTGLSVSTGDHDGELDGHTNRLAGSDSYPVAVADAPSGPWQIVALPSRSKWTIESLPRGKTIWVRVAGHDSHGIGAWCEPVQATVP